MENVTTPDQYELLEMSKISGFVNRAKGTGRPTKKADEIWIVLYSRNISMILILTSMIMKMKNKQNRIRIMHILCYPVSGFFI